MSLKVFISYSSKNREIAIRVRDAVRSWGYETWMDVDEIKGGEYWPTDIQNGLDTSQVVVGILTKDAVDSREVWAEWNHGYKKSILILLRYEDVSLNYRWEILNYLNCIVDENAGLAQLKSSLEDPSLVRTNLTIPDYVRPSNQTTPALSYQSLPEKPESISFIKRPIVRILLVLLIVIVVGYWNSVAAILLGIALTFILGLLSLMPNDENKAKMSKPDNRTRMLENVYQTWIIGALKPNIQAGTFDLSLALKADAVLHHIDYGEYKLPDNSKDIVQIFNEVQRELLILGEPGSGKTILMLQLAEQLLASAQTDEKLPIPIVLNLSSWTQKKQPLYDWLVSELKRSYGVPEKQAKDWLDKEQLTLLLDGLDEIAPSQFFGDSGDTNTLEIEAIKLRSEAIETINTFRRRYASVDIVVCSRVRDYEALTEKFDLNSAILLKALNDAQIEIYLEGAEYSGIRELLQKEHSARNLAGVPFILSTMKNTYKDFSYLGNPFKSLKLQDVTSDTRRDHLFRKYVDLQQDNYPTQKYTRQKRLVYLQWLAFQMLNNKKSIFYIEDLHPNWASVRTSFLYTVWLVFILIVLLLIIISEGLILDIAVSLLVFLLGTFPIETNIRFAEKLTWTLRQKAILISLLSALGMGLIIGLRSEANLGLGYGLLQALILGFVLGIEPKPFVHSRVKPNSGLIQSIKNGFFAGISLTLIAGLFVRMYGGMFEEPTEIFFGLLNSILLVGYAGGWRAVLQHIILRFILISENKIPRWRYDTFLDNAAEAGILRKVGGGYIFRHRMLMEYFAEQYQKDDNNKLAETEVEVSSAA